MSMMTTRSSFRRMLDDLFSKNSMKNSFSLWWSFEINKMDFEGFHKDHIEYSVHFASMLKISITNLNLKYAFNFSNKADFSWNVEQRKLKKLFVLFFPYNQLSSNLKTESEISRIRSHGNIIFWIAWIYGFFCSTVRTTPLYRGGWRPRSRGSGLAAWGSWWKVWGSAKRE